jgi:hypothetical protein
MTREIIKCSPGRRTSGRGPDQCCQGEQPHQQEQLAQHKQEHQPVTQHNKVSLTNHYKIIIYYMPLD